MILRFLAATTIILSQSAFGLILFGGDNTTNTTGAGTGAPFNTVAQLSNGAGGIGGTGIHLGNGYILTANHVTPFNSVTFDGTTDYTIDNTFAATRIGATDLKVFRITESNPMAGMSMVGSASLYTGTAEAANNATIIGWGQGRNPATPINTDTVGWADPSAKRWGTNAPTRTISGFQSDLGTYQAIETVLGNTIPGSSEAGATLYDSGGAMFQEIGGSWFLTGIASLVVQQSGPNTSTFGIDVAYIGNNAASGSANIVRPVGAGDANYFNRISPYTSQINSTIGVIPEPSSLLLILASLPFFLRRKR